VALSGRTDRAIISEALARHGLDTDQHTDALITAFGDLVEARGGSFAEEMAMRGGRVLAGAGAAVSALAAEPSVVQSVLSGNIARAGSVKLGAFGEFDPLDLTLSAFGDHHLLRADLVDVAREKFARRYPGVERYETVLIGDTPLDVEAGRLSGARVVAVATGQYGVRELSECGASAVLADLTDTAAVVAAVLGRSDTPQ
jgi:hypothetical protein